MHRLLIGLLLMASLPMVARGQAITPQGTPTTFDVATWNIEWFGSSSNGPSDDERQFQNVKQIIAEADIDLWAVQEIANRDLFGRLTQELGADYEGIIAQDEHSGSQRIGFIYNTNVIQPRRVQHILTDPNEYDFAGRPPLQLEANVTINDTTVVVTFIVVHMKAFSDLNSYNRRVKGARDLKIHMDFATLFSQPGVPMASQPVVLLGDFNDLLEGSITAGQTRSPFAIFLEDTTDYFAPSLRIDQANEATFCGSSTLCSGSSTIDHIVITNELTDAYVTDSADRYESLLQEVSGYVFNTSDHLPVYARFDFSATGVSQERLPSTSTLVRLHSPYPNPTSQTTTLTLDLPRAQTVRLSVFDILGREVTTVRDGFLRQGTHYLDIDTSSWATGTFLIRLETATGTSVRPLVVLP